MTGYETNTLLCMPITDTDGVVIGVTQVINKRGGQEFTKDDEKLLQTYLSFFGIALANARLFEASRQEQLNNKALLEVVHDLFEEQDALDGIVLKIMQKTLRLLKCERCCVFLLDDNGLEVTFNKLFDLTAPNRTKSKQASGQANTGSSNTDKFADLRVAKRIIEQVASNGDVVNIADADMDFRIDHQANGLYDVQIKRLLCIPIRNRNTNIIGVTQIVNRTDGECFDETDEALFEAVAIFYGLGINNTIMYNEQKKITAMQSVALEVLSYHTSTSPQEAMVLAATTLPDQVRNVNLKELLFDNFSLNSMEMLAAGVEFFGQLGLVTKFNIDTQVLCRWLLTIRKNYRNVVYHNWCHAFNVCQTMFGILKTTDVGNKISDLEKLALLVGCFCHDLDHRGTNNAFHVKTQSPLALLYGTSATMEQHHFNHAVMILNSEGHNIFSSMSAADYSAVMNLLKEAILATDLLLHFKAYKNFGPLVAEKKLDETQPNHMHMLRSCLMTACDISACTKAWEIQCKVAEQIASEFWAQGDKEKQELKVQPAAQMDRERMHDLPKLQKQWLEGICLPLYTTLANLSDGFQPMLAGIEDNYKKWGELAETNSYEFSLVNGHAATPNASPTDLFAEQNQRSLLT